MIENKMVKGTMIMSIGIFFSKLIGLLFVFPFASMVGGEGMALYSYAYVPYALFLDLSTIGLPMGMAKMVSKYNAKNEYKTSFKIFKHTTVWLTFFGILACFLMVLLSPLYARIVLGGQDKITNSVTDVEFVIQTISLALIVIPVVSLLRGFFQGFRDVIPSTVSQLIEQIVRITFILGAVYFILYVKKGAMVDAVSAAVFSAFISSLFALLVLLIFYYNKSSYYNKLKNQSTEHKPRKLHKLYIELFFYAIPFAVFSLNYVLYQFIDSFTFNRALINSGAEDIEMLYGIYSFEVQKLALIPVTIATAFGVNLVTTITNAYFRKDNKAVQKNVELAFQIVMFFVIPAVIGLIVLADDLYPILYSDNKYGSSILKMYAPLAIFFSLSTISMAILQGINKQKVLYKSLLLGILIKLILNYPFIYLFSVNGAIYSTMLGFGVTITMNFINIRKNMNLNMKYLARRIIVITLLAFIMGVGLQLLKINLQQHIQSKVIRVSILTLVGSAFYLLASHYFGLLEGVFGGKIKIFKLIKRK